MRQASLMRGSLWREFWSAAPKAASPHFVAALPNSLESDTKKKGKHPCKHCLPRFGVTVTQRTWISKAKDALANSKIAAVAGAEAAVGCR